VGILRSFDVSASGLTAQRLRLDVIASNIANVSSTRTAEGGPYRRRVALLAARDEGPARTGLSLLGAGAMGAGAEAGASGVWVPAILQDPTPSRLEYSPGHPDANAEGYVLMPNVNMVTEMIDLVTATRAYEANVTALNAAKSMALRALDIGRG
jgi:flagellar basal-body rod protein FlgC